MTIYTVGIGLSLTPDDLKAMLPEELRNPMHCAVIDIRRDPVSRNHAWDWGHRAVRAETPEAWACYRHVPELANSTGAPAGEWRPYLGGKAAEKALAKLADMLAREDALGPICLVLLCQCSKLEERYKRDGRLKSQCHRVAVAEELARRTGAEVVHLS